MDTIQKQSLSNSEPIKILYRKENINNVDIDLRVSDNNFSFNSYASSLLQKIAKEQNIKLDKIIIDSYFESNFGTNLSSESLIQIYKNEQEIVGSIILKTRIKNV